MGRSDEATTEFVKLYMKHECLWNPEHPQYTHKIIRDRAFSEITESFNNTFNVSLSNEEVKKKCKNLRKTYLQQVGKILEKSTPDYIYPPTLVWFEEMDKYMKHVRSTRQNTNIPSKQVDSSPQSWNMNDIPNENSNNFDSDPLIRNSDEEYTEKPSVEYLDTSLFSTKMNNNKFRRKCILSEDRNLKLEEVYGSMQDEFEIYGKYIASQLRQLNLQNAIQVQLRIQTLISEARLTELADS